MGKLTRVLIMAGGTGGHVFPGLAVAKCLRDHNVEVHWLGTAKGLEARLVPEAQFPIHYISISGIRGKNWKELLLAPWRLSKAILQSLKILKQINPDVVIGMGGFVSGPGGIASWLLRKPLVVHEQNARPGTTNKWLARVAKKVLEGFPDTFSHRERVITTGNPVRSEIIAVANPDERFKNRQSPLRLLVIGGSLGATAINEMVPHALAKMAKASRPEVLHQSGEKHFQETQQLYSKLEVEADIKPFIVEMEKAYAWADIVLCRAGALTVAELCTVGLGAILIPFPYAVDDHQTVNAQFMVKNNAAFLIKQADLTEDNLATLLTQLTTEREKCFLMAQSAYKSRRIDATAHVIKICEEICH